MQWPAPMSGGPVLTMAMALLDPLPAVDDERLEFLIEYCASGDFPSGAGAWLEGSRSLVDDDWQEIGFLPGWRYADRRTTGDIVEDADGATFAVSRAGGWRRTRLVAQAVYQRVRLVVADRSGEEGTRGPFCLREIVIEAYPFFSYRSRAAFTFLSGGRPFTGKLWRGVRVEQRGECGMRVAVRDPAGGERITPREGYRRIAGDGTGGGMVALGLAGVEVAPEFEVAHDEFWELSAVGFHVQALSEWAA